MAIIATDYETVRRSLRYRKRKQFEQALAVALKAPEGNALKVLADWAPLSERVFISLMTEDARNAYESAKKETEETEN